MLDVVANHAQPGSAGINPKMGDGESRKSLCLWAGSHRIFLFPNPLHIGAKEVDGQNEE
jgi:hypothetical protein